MRSRYDPILRRIIRQVAEEEDIPYNDSEAVYLSVFRQINKLVKEDICPRIFVPNLGSFFVEYRVVSGKIYGYIQRYRHGVISYETLVSKINKYWPVRRRVQQEKASRSHKKKGRIPTKTFQ